MKPFEANKLIAEFMGSNLNGLESWQYEEELQYHTSWDWLMPVIDKVKSIDHDWIDQEAQHIIDDIDNALTCCWGIDAVHGWTVDAIISYNKWNTYFRGERYNK
tara:strand:+ start:68 stop:379 length:312 start_codon:yes stop_codon:yes gene_type:complete